jgi:hypothetical protein
MARDPAMTGMAGVHHVASVLLYREIHAAITTGNAPNVDVLAGLKQGTATLGIQVKTTEYALRYRGRGEDKRPYEYQFPLGRKYAKVLIPGLWFAFVDLKRFESLPDAYILNSQEVVSAFEGVEELKLWRFHRSVEEMERHRNAWQHIEEELARIDGSQPRER